jgi:hypothetical protein
MMTPEVLVADKNDQGRRAGRAEKIATKGAASHQYIGFPEMNPLGANGDIELLMLVFLASNMSNLMEGS